jgi:hypothetical protein
MSVRSLLKFGDKMQNIKTLILLVFFLLASESWAKNSECATKAELSLHSGHYAKKSILEGMEKEKIWFKVNQKFSNGYITAVNIEKNGDYVAIADWHEGSPNTCLRFRGEELYATDSTSAPLKWQGPFIRVGDTHVETIYFNKMFNNQCFISKAGERWCFNNSEIVINNKAYKAFLELDMSELPIYGTIVSIYDNPFKNTTSGNDVLVFVPFKGGWKIYKDTCVTDDEYKEVNPNKDPAWQILLPIH